MLPSYFVVKKEAGYMTFRAHSMPMEGQRCYKITPLHVNEVTVTGIQVDEDTDVQQGDLFIQRRLYSGEGFHNFRCSVVSSDICFIVTLAELRNHSTIAPLVSFREPHSDRIYGHRYTKGDISYLWMWDASDPEKQEMFKFGRPNDTLVNYTPNGVEKISIPVPVTQTVRQSSQPVEIVSVGGSMVPRHVLRGFVESLIGRNESCPITMDELTTESACVTPCYHVLSYEGARGWVASHRSCPICRTPCQEAELVRV